MRQIGEPPTVDQDMTRIVEDVLTSRGFRTIDATSSTGARDYLDRILGLIRGTGVTVAVFSHETRPNAMANIALELGFAAMCGKPLIIAKSKDAKAPSDLTRTDWLEYEAAEPDAFRAKVTQAIDIIGELVDFQDVTLATALEAPKIDCAIAFERANKGFLLSGEERFIRAAETILEKLQAEVDEARINDPIRLRGEISMFIRQARNALAPPAPARRGRPRRATGDATAVP